MIREWNERVETNVLCGCTLGAHDLWHAATGDAVAPTTSREEERCHRERPRSDLTLSWLPPTTTPPSAAPAWPNTLRSSWNGFTSDASVEGDGAGARRCGCNCSSMDGPRALPPRAGRTAAAADGDCASARAEQTPRAGALAPERACERAEAGRAPRPSAQPRAAAGATRSGALTGYGRAAGPGGRGDAGGCGLLLGAFAAAAAGEWEGGCRLECSAATASCSSGSTPPSLRSCCRACWQACLALCAASVCGQMVWISPARASTEASEASGLVGGKASAAGAGRLGGALPRGRAPPPPLMRSPPPVATVATVACAPRNGSCRRNVSSP